MFCSFTANL